MKKFLLIILLITMISAVYAADQTQQFNKIYLSPFYRVSLSSATNYNYTLNVQPPDGISTVVAAIMTFNAQINGQTQNFTLKVNNQSCNNPDYSIATAFSTTGNSQIYFDCSNIINKEGSYNITLRSSVNTGTVQGWADITYMNDPGRKLDIFGTEYTIGDNGKVFVQLLENSLTPINNASCYITVFTPSGTIWYDKSLMSYQSGSNGMYYFDFTAPVTKGVYMTDIYCEYYTNTQTNKADAYSQLSGWYVSGNGASVTEVDSDYLITVEKNTNNGSVANLTTVLMAHLDEYTGTSTLDSSSTPATGTHYNTPAIGIPGQAGSAGVRYGNTANDYTQFSAASKFNLAATDAYMVCFSFNQSASETNGDRLISAETGADVIRFSFDGTDKIRFVSDRSGTVAQQIETTVSGAYIDSQWHTVCGYSNFTTMQLYIDGSLLVNSAKTQSGTLTAGTMSFGAKDGGTGNDLGSTLMDEVCYIKGTQANFNSPTPQTLATNYNTNKQCGIPTNTLDLNVSISSGVTVFSNYINWNIVTTYKWDELVETANIYIYNYTGSSWYKLPNALSYAIGTDSIVSSQFTSNISNFISGGVMTFRINDSLPNGTTIGRLSLNQIKLVQTAYVQIPATQIRGGGEIHVNDIPGATWFYPTRTLTAYPNLTAAIDTNAIWNASNRSLTYYADMTNYTNITDGVWNYPGNVSTNILSQLSDTIWNYVGRYVHGILYS
jgi:hypothetical protein